MSIIPNSRDGVLRRSMNFNKFTPRCQEHQHDISQSKHIYTGPYVVNKSEALHNGRD